MSFISGILMPLFLFFPVCTCEENNTLLCLIEGHFVRTMSKGFGVCFDLVLHTCLIHQMHEVAKINLCVLCCVHACVCMHEMMNTCMYLFNKLWLCYIIKNYQYQFLYPEETLQDALSTHSLFSYSLQKLWFNYWFRGCLSIHGNNNIVTKLQFFLQVIPPKCSKPYLFSDYSFWGRLSTVSRKPEWSQCRRGFSLAKRGKRGWCSQGNAVGAEVNGVGENGGVQSRRVLHQAEHGAVWVNRTPLFRSSSLFIVHVPRQSRLVEFLE